jgi:hypothetical protein
MKKSWKVLETEREYDIALKRTIEVFNAEMALWKGLNWTFFYR